MGYSKVVKVSNRQIRILHQLADGKPYAEDVTITIDEQVDPSRLDYLASQDGKIGVLYLSFSPSNPQPEGVTFPE